MQVVSRALLEAIAIPVEVPNTQSNGHGNGAYTHEGSSLESFMQKHQIRYTSKDPYQGGTRYKLEVCAWDSSHTDSSACLYDMPHGFGASCSHNSCHGKGWRDYRVVFEPDAYTRRERKEQKQSVEAKSLFEDGIPQGDVIAIEEAIETEDFKALFKPEAIVALAQLNRSEYALYKDRIKSAFGKRVSISDLNAAVNEARGILKGVPEDEEKTSLDVVADDFAANHKEDWAYNPLSSAWYQWKGTHWQNMQDTEAQKKSCVTLDKLVRDLMRGRELGINRGADLDCVVRLAAIHCKREFSSTPGVVNFRNGTLEVSTETMRPHDREDELTYCIPYDYDAKGQWPIICGFLTSLFPDKYARQNFMVHVGLSLMGDTKMHYAGAIIGPPRVGKSTALDLANLTCGLQEKEYAGKTLFNPDIEGKRSRFMQNKKRVVCVDELPVSALRNEDTVKNMTAHSGVEMRGMNRDEELDNKWRPKIFMAMNERPEYKDTSGAIKERIIPLIVGSTRPKDQRDLALLDKMKPELGGFAASCIRMAKGAFARGYYPLSGAMKLIIGEMESANNPLKSFVQDHCILDPNGFMFTDELFVLYVNYCEEAKNIPLAKYKMSSELSQMGKGITQKRKRNPAANGEPKRGLLGIRLRVPEDPQIEIDPVADLDDPMLDVYDVYDTCTTLFECRTHDRSAPEAGLDTPVNDVYDINFLNTYRGTRNSQIEEDLDAKTQSSTFPICNSRDEIAFTSYTDSVEPPVERVEAVYDSENTLTTPRTRRTQSEQSDNAALLPEEHQDLFTRYEQKIWNPKTVATPMWSASDSGFKNTMFGKEGHVKFTMSLLRSEDGTKVAAALEAMKRTLGEYGDGRRKS